MKVIIGLGNPGQKYAKSRHNIGWMILEELAVKIGAPDFKESAKFKALITECATKEDISEKILLVKPLTFMNLSGESVGVIKSFYKLENEDLLIIYDDIDLPLGELRYRTNGGPGTHNGMKSIVERIGENFPRLRFGIENRTSELKEKMDLSDYVLNGFTKEEEPVIRRKVQTAVEIILMPR